MPKLPKSKEPRAPKELERTTAWINLFASVVDRVGWPGLLVLTFCGLLFGWASADQKRQFIDLYFLGKGIGNVWPIVVLSIIFCATVVAQVRVYGKKIALIEKELERVGNEKSQLQQELTTAKLKRGKSKSEEAKP
jgi:hypothetical protein